MIGQTVAHYEITALVGKGGMGEVYRARDTKLGRDVALKVISREMSADPERQARLQREARTLASLQHANIASIYGFEAVDGVQFLVMELVEGVDLEERLRNGALDRDESLDIARQIATGLEVAHEQGIVHRDLKPANVKITSDGQVKILDFGLARAVQGDRGSAGDPATSPTITANMTVAGTILGTAAYMSPEQARGKAVDKRADVWSFGVILFEMLTGTRLFAGETVSDTLAGVLKTDIDLQTLPKSTPPALRRLLDRCLDRDPTTRLRDIGEARITLVDPSAQDVAPTKSRGAFTLRGIALAVVVGTGLGTIISHLLLPSKSAEVDTGRQFQIAIPRTGDSVPRLALDPQGTRIVYQSGQSFWLRNLAQRDSRPIPGTEDALVITWSPDGEWIAFATLKTIYRSRPDGSARQRVGVIETDMHEWAGEIVWTEDDRIVFTTGDAGTFSVPAAGGDVRAFVRPDSNEADFHSLALLPDGRGFAIHPHVDLEFSSIDVFDGQVRREVLRMPGQSLNGVQYAAGHLLFMREPDNPGIWAVPFSIESLATTGDPFLVVSDASFPAVSRRGDLAYVVQGRRNGQIVRLGDTGLITARIGEALPGTDGLAISPDGRRAAVVVDDGDPQVWIVDLETGDRRALRIDERDPRQPSWSPDGKSIALVVGPLDSGLRTLVVGTDDSSRLVLPVRGLNPGFTPDGRALILSIWDEANEPDIGVVSIDDPAAPPRMLAERPQLEENPVLSPDGTLVAYESVESGRREIYVVSFADGSGKVQVSRAGGSNPTWSTDGERLHFRSSGRGAFMTVSVSRDPLRFSSPYVEFETESLRDITPAEDGGYLALDLNLSASPEFRVWVNWAQTLGASMRR